MSVVAVRNIVLINNQQNLCHSLLRALVSLAVADPIFFGMASTSSFGCPSRSRYSLRRRRHFQAAALSSSSSSSSMSSSSSCLSATEDPKRLLDRRPSKKPKAGSSLRRCLWVSRVTDSDYLRYHDEEWGVPVVSDEKLFELLCLEGQQAGLSWHCVLTKREHYKHCFHSFSLAKVLNHPALRLDYLLTVF